MEYFILFLDKKIVLLNFSVKDNIIYNQNILSAYKITIIGGLVKFYLIFTLYRTNLISSMLLLS